MITPPGSVGMVLLGDEIGHMFGCVTRRVLDAEDRLAEGKLITILELFGLEAVACAALVARVDFWLIQHARTIRARH